MMSGNKDRESRFGSLVLKKNLIFIIIFINCISLNSKENIDSNILKIAEEVAMQIKYYDSKDNYYKGSDEFEGYCADYAVLFALKTGANLVVQNQTRKEVPNGIYKLVDNIPVDMINEIKGRLVNNHRSGLIGPWDDARYPIILYHPRIGFYSIELIERKTVKTHFGYIMKEKHIWNELNGVIFDICWADAGNEPFTGIDTY